MNTYSFAVSVQGLDVEDPDQVEQLYGADFVVAAGTSDGLTTVEAEIEAPSGEAAIQRLLAFFATALPEVKALRIDEHLVTTSEIAEALGLSRESVRLWASGRRGIAPSPHIAPSLAARRSGRGQRYSHGPEPLAATSTRTSEPL